MMTDLSKALCTTVGATVFLGLAVGAITASTDKELRADNGALLNMTAYLILIGIVLLFLTVCYWTDFVKNGAETKRRLIREESYRQAEREHQMMLDAMAKQERAERARCAKDNPYN